MYHNILQKCGLSLKIDTYINQQTDQEEMACLDLCVSPQQLDRLKLEDDTFYSTKLNAFLNLCKSNHFKSQDLNSWQT